MILVDTSVWLDHLRQADPRLQRLLENRQVLSHPFVIGELAVGSLKQRNIILDDLQSLPHAIVALDHEVLTFLANRSLFGLGIGYIDVHLLASAQMTPDAFLWTRDKRLQAAAARLSLALPFA